MTGRDRARASPGNGTGPLVVALLRVALAVVFVYMGLSKAMQPVDFLKMVRQYDVIQQPGLLNIVATVVPWFEVFCGLLLLFGVAVRGTALVVLLMLGVFTGIV